MPPRQVAFLNALPVNGQELRDRWEGYHAARTFLSVAGLALLVIGGLLGAG